MKTAFTEVLSVISYDYHLLYYIFRYYRVESSEAIVYLFSRISLIGKACFYVLSLHKMLKWRQSLLSKQV